MNDVPQKNTKGLGAGQVRILTRMQQYPNLNWGISDLHLRMSPAFAKRMMTGLIARGLVIEVAGEPTKYRVNVKGVIA